MVGLGKPETSDQRTRNEPGKKFLPLRIAAIGVNGVNDQRILNTQHRAIARIHALKLARNQSISYVIGPSAPFIRGQRRAQESERPHLLEKASVKSFMAKVLDHTRKKFFMRKAPRVIAHQFFIVAELVFKKKRIEPVKRRTCFAVHEITREKRTSVKPIGSGSENHAPPP